MSSDSFIRIDIPPELKVKFRELSFRNGEDMTAVLKREILAYLDRVDWKDLIQARIEGRESPDDSVYSNKDVAANEEKSRQATSDHIRFGLSKDEKSNLQKVSNLRGIVMSALVRLMIVRYVDEGASPLNASQFDFSDTSKDFFGFNLPVEVDREFKEACKKCGVSKSRVLRNFLARYLERVQWSEEYQPLNDDPEFPASEVKDEELSGKFKFTHIVLDKASKNKIELACRSRGIRPSSLFRLMICRFIENPSLLQIDERPESVRRGSTSVEFSCPGELFDLFSDVCSKKMTSAPIVLKQYLLDYIGRVDRSKIRQKKSDTTSDSEFPNEEIWEEDSGGDAIVNIPLTIVQKRNLDRICKIRNIDVSALSRVIMGRYVVANRL